MLRALPRLFRKAPPEPRWIEIAELRRRLDEATPPLVVDVRGPDEFDGPLGHIVGALNIPLPELTARRGEIADDQPVVFVCLTDRRSAAAAAQFAAEGPMEVSVLRGGIKAWREME